MADSTEESSCPPFLQHVVGRYNTLSPAPNRPFVTLTFAQSLDAKIAGSGGRQLILSGTESMRMTHWMRTMHDAILIGIGTALHDNPQLNVRHLPPPPSTSKPHHLPRPVIIDTNLRLSPTCKLLQNFRNGTGRRPWIISKSPAPDISDTESTLPDNFSELWSKRKQILEESGAKIVEIAQMGNKSKEIPISSTLQALQDLGIRSVMVEGGARIIASFLSEDVVDSLIITTAPVLVGSAGIGYACPTSFSENGEIKMEFEEVNTELFGRDTVIALMKRDSTYS